MTIHRNRRSHSAKCRFGLGCIDEEFIAPRLWTLWNVRRPWTTENVCENDERLLDDCFYQPAWRVSGDIYSDYRNFHSGRGLALLGLGIGMHAILANTSLDQRFRDSFQDHAVSDPNAFEIGRHLGDVWVTVPLVVAAWSLGECLEQEPDEGRRRVGRKLNAWGAQTGRALFAGATATGTLQVLIGASRPNEFRGSKWRPFDDSNGVSGHAFVGAVPFLVAAKHTDNRLLKTALVIGSGITGYSRIYDDKHYLSQALLGWWIAHLAVEATDLTNRSSVQYRLVPIGHKGYAGIGIEFRR
ncbi:phosphatase PAP2 family protein [Novipirellula artificiosorum]|uniref:phosphatase PAP2 family protein n=1 Tax=Novipirellula artificiosorum TaxID=2528016 RepID=UPI0018CDA10F|nr:phosphatase PAP2 family protein [Novipirellula artificiosorum]